MTARYLLRLAAAAAAWRGRAQAAESAVRRLLAGLPEELAAAAGRRRARHMDWTTGAGRAREPFSRLRVAAVQMEIRPEPSPAAYARHVFGFFLRAAEAEADVVAFPEDAATGLVALLPGFGLLARAGSPEAAAAGGGAGLTVADVMAMLGPAVAATYRTVFAAFAQAFGMYVMAGTANLPDSQGRVFNVAHVYAPDGRLVARQPKLHLFPHEAEWGLVPGTEMHAWDTPWGRMAAPVCMDATYFETARIARALGADVVLLPIANPEAFHLWKARRGVWGRCQEGGFYAVQSALVGNFLGLRIEGRSGVFGPLDLSPQGDGVLAEAKRADAEDVVVADLDLEALRAWREAEPRVTAPGWWRALLP